MSDGRAYPARPIVGVGAVIVVRGDDAAAVGWSGEPPAAGVVLVRRAHEPLKGQWSLPGGAVEVGESLEAAITREVEEECGLDVRVGLAVDVFDRILLDAAGRVEYHFVLVDYVCRPRGGQLRAGSDVDAVTIADASALEPYKLTDKALEVIGRALQHVVEK